MDLCCLLKPAFVCSDCKLQLCETCWTTKFPKLEINFDAGRRCELTLCMNCVDVRDRQDARCWSYYPDMRNE